MQSGTSKVESVCSIRGGFAESLLAEVTAAPRTRLLAGIAGAGGSGKSVLLDEVEARYRAAGVQVRRAHPDWNRLNPAECGTILVDDAHQLSDSVLTRIHSVIDKPGVNLVVAYRLWPRPPALSRLTTAIEQHHAPVVLGPLAEDDIAASVAAVLGGSAPPSLVSQIMELTGGMPWLVHRVMEAIHRGGPGIAADPLLSRGLMAQLGYELDGVDDDLHKLLLALTVGFDLTGRIPPVLEHSGEGLDNLVTRARAAGLLLPSGRLVPLVRHAVLQTTPVYQVRAFQRTLVDTFTTEGRSLSDVARGLARGGLKDLRVAHALEREGDSVLASQPVMASTLYGEAEAAGSDELSTAARRAQAALATGDVHTAGRIVDSLLEHDDAPDLLRGVDVAAAVWAQRGMLARSADIYRWLGSPGIGQSATLAAIAMIGTGDREGAESMLRSAVLKGPPTVLTVAVSLMGQGIGDSVQQLPVQALPSLIRASDMMTAFGGAVPLPDVPAALAALVAMHGGELDVADGCIRAALKGGQGGLAAQPRLLLLKAWVAMLRDQPEQARADIRRATVGAPGLAPRDELFLRALEVGLARRTDDVPTLVRAWQHAREGISHIPIDLYSLLPLGELVVAAARLRDSSRLEYHLAEAWALLARLGDPPLWSVPLHWAAVQAAILTERPADMAPHAAALVGASQRSHLAAVLSKAGRSWISVLAGNFDAAAVEAAARGLASVGLTWDGSRLAGHAAARVDERKDMARLLACARDLHPRPEVTPSAAVTSTPDDSAATDQVGSTAKGTGLSAREREVARLVLDGKTYREIGAAIFISPRTAEHHIARIRRRLGVTTRSELLTQLRLALSEDDTPTEVTKTVTLLHPATA